jgi:hypothetical protein
LHRQSLLKPRASINNLASGELAPEAASQKEIAESWAPGLVALAFSFL